MFTLRSSLSALARIQHHYQATTRSLKPCLSRFFATKFPIVQDPHARKLSFEKPIDLSSWRLDTILDREQIVKVTDLVLKLNPSRKFTELFTKKNWDIENFNQQNLPAILGSLNLRFFSKREDQYLLFMDMPIRMPGLGKGWRIPKELEQFRETIEKCVYFERLVNPNLDQCYVYLTVDQRPVLPGQSQRRTGYHSDSYINSETRLKSKEQTVQETDSIYLAYDCLPTEFCAGPFPFGDLNPNDTEAVLKHFEQIGATLPATTYPSHTLLRMGPECIHRVGFNTSKNTVNRTFFKLTFSKQVFNRQGNEHNGLFDYNWPLVPRSDTRRNHANIVFEPAKEFGVIYNKWSAAKLQEAFKQIVEGQVLYATKSSIVKAHLATPGELLQTTDGDFATTVNCANLGDWKITTKTGSQYFLPGKLFERFYTAKGAGTFTSQPEVVSYIRLDQFIQIQAPWGRVQYLRPGDVLVKRGEQDIYGVLKKDFEASYYYD